MNNYLLLRLGLFLLGILATAVSLDAQPLKIGNRDTTMAKRKISGKLLQTLFNTTEAAYNLYAVRATMLDPATQKVSGRSTTDFRDLFVPSPFVYNDIGVDTTAIPARDYATQAYSYLRNFGIKFDLKEPRFESVDYDSAGYYRVSVRVVKLLYNGINDKQAQVTYPEDCPRKSSILMRFEVDKDQLLSAKITEIRGRELSRECPTALPSIIGFGPGIFMTNSNPQFRNRLGNSPHLKLELGQATYYGLHFMRPLIPKKNFLIGAALGYSSQSTSAYTVKDTILRDIVVKDNTKLQVYQFEERGKLTGIDLALGFGYQKKLKGPISAGIMVWATGSLPTSNEATQNYQLNYRTSSLLKQPYKGLSDTSTVVNQSQFRLGARLSPFVTYLFNPQMGLQLECNYHLMLNSVYSVVPEDDDFFDQYESLREQERTVGALSTAFESFKYNSLGFRLAFIYSISK